MPIHINPAINAREYAEEAAGLIVPLNSTAVTALTAAQSAGTASKSVPNVVIKINGTQYIPH
jgi:hypothetical protein